LKRKSLVLATLAAAVSAAVVAAIALAAGGGSTPNGVTIHLVEKSQSFNFVDNPPSGAQSQIASAGDLFVLSSNLFTRSGKRAGALDASCVSATGGKNNTSVCTGVFRLAAGQLDLMTSIRGQGGRVTEIAVVGGTGAYEGARGSIESISNGPNSNISHDTVHLLLP
jgi:hypothetical protein